MMFRRFLKLTIVASAVMATVFSCSSGTPSDPSTDSDLRQSLITSSGDLNNKVDDSLSTWGTQYGISAGTDVSSSSDSLAVSSATDVSSDANSVSSSVVSSAGSSTGTSSGTSAGSSTGTSSTVVSSSSKASSASTVTITAPCTVSDAEVLSGASVTWTVDAKATGITDFTYVWKIGTTPDASTTKDMSAVVTGPTTPTVTISATGATTKVVTCPVSTIKTLKITGTCIADQTTVPEGTTDVTWTVAPAVTGEPSATFTYDWLVNSTSTGVTTAAYLSTLLAATTQPTVKVSASASGMTHDTTFTICPKVTVTLAPKLVPVSLCATNDCYAKVVTGGNSGELGLTAGWYVVETTIAGWGTSNEGSRVYTVNGTVAAPGSALTALNGKYWIYVSAGSVSYAAFYWW